MSSEELKDLCKLLKEWLRCTDPGSAKHKLIEQCLEEAKTELWENYRDVP